MPLDFEIRVHEKHIIDIKALQFFDADNVAVADHEPFRRVSTFVEAGIAAYSCVGTLETGNDEPAFFTVVGAFSCKTNS
jgi:hypothetical protein